MEIKGVKIGDQFKKDLSKGKFSICEVVDLIERKSIKTGKLIDVECWAKSIDNKFSPNHSFEVAFATVKRGAIPKEYNKEVNNLNGPQWQGLIEKSYNVPIGNINSENWKKHNENI